MTFERQSASGAGRDRGERPVVVIGAGMGGLACAIDLARNGRPVLLLEQASRPGGKLREVEVAGRGIDAGPTVLTMRWVLDELFEAAGSSVDAHLSLRAADILARHAWSASEHLDLFADADRSASAIAEFAGPGEARHFRDFCARAAATYRTLERPFIRGSRPTPLSLATRVGWSGLPALLKISPFSTLWASLGDHFRDPRLRQLFGRYATYCGSSPYLAPATLMLVAHVEQQGVWRVEGGMYRIAEALAALATTLGVAIRYDAAVKEIVVRDGRAAGVLVGHGPHTDATEFIEADQVVFNGDVAALGAGLLGAEATAAAAAVPPSRRSLSALTWTMVGKFVRLSAAAPQRVFRRRLPRGVRQHLS